MKKIILTTAIILGIGFASQAQTKLGIHFGYGTEIKKAAIGANAEFGITDKITIAPDFTYFLTEKTEFVKVSFWELNANAHYYFLDEDKFKVFGLGGLNYAHSKVTMDIPLGGIFGGGDGSFGGSKIGLNIGGGATYDLADRIQAFSTLKYALGGAEQLAIFIGARYIL